MLYFLFVLLFAIIICALLFLRYDISVPEVCKMSHLSLPPSSDKVTLEYSMLFM